MPKYCEPCRRELIRARNRKHVAQPTLCIACGINPPKPKRAARGFAPKFCEACTVERERARWRRVAAEAREKPDYADKYRQYYTAYRRRPDVIERKREQIKAHYVRAWGGQGWASRFRRYGLKPEHVQAWLEFQEGNCALCGEPLSARFHVDHDHDTGIVRGLLHEHCNLKLDQLPNRERYLLGWVA